MREIEVRDAYAGRASEYISLFGSVDNAHEQDQRCIAGWAGSLVGPVVDAGCGPGHWSAFLRSHGADVEGVDLVPSFIEQARVRFPEATFRVGSFTELGVDDGQLGGILAWYSLIHLRPGELQSTLGEFGRCINLGGSVLVGFFEGADGEAFPHAVTTAYSWSVDGMAAMLGRAGFDVLDVHARTDPGRRPHAAMIARRTKKKSVGTR